MKFLSRLFLPLLLVLFASGITYAQVKTYDAEWKKVDDLVQNKNLPRTALEQVKKIYVKAKKEKQQAQIIKSLVYMISLQQRNRENNHIVAIQEITKEVSSSTEPATSILKSLLAGLYWQYFQTHRWQLYDRTNTAGIPVDIATWSIEDFHKKIGDLFLQSIAHDRLLKQTQLTSYDAIIDKGTVRPLRPTMYDLLAHRALEYFKNPERDIQKPVYAFEISQREAFAPAAAFTKYTFQTKDSASLQYKALQIYQKLIGFHLQKNNLDALVDVDIDRIEFVYSHSVNEHKDSLYVNALQQLITAYPNAVATNQAAYLLAAFYNQQAAQYNPLQDTTHRFDRVKAKEILQRIVRDSSIKNEGWANSFNLLQQINRNSFSFEVEKVNVPAQPFRGLVKYKNISNLHFRLIAAGEALKKQMQVYDGREKYWSSLLNAAAIKSWNQNLPVNNDLQDHSVEIKIDALPPGEYFLVASSDGKFSSNSLLAAQLFYVSNISYVNSGNDYFVLHRQTGEPLPNAAVNVYKQTYDYKTSKYVKTNVGAYKTNKNGFFSITKDTVNRSYGYLLDVTYGEDTLSLNDQTYHYYNYNNGEDDEDTVRKIFFFTDRSIYRPGQTVYFKGIVVQSQNADSKVEPNYVAELFLEDANGEDIDSLELTSNEFGSFSGRFQLPQHALNGSFRIYDADDENSTSFSVEEYKRPNFQVSFDTLSSRYKVNDTIAVTGIAKAYAGNLLSNAKVVYRVVRQRRFIYPWLVRKTWFPPAAPMEIAHGQTETDVQGHFQVQFAAIPDKNIDRNLNPVFDYKIYADVTDITGETRSAENSISAGYSSLILSLNLPGRLPVDSMNKIFVRTENMSGQYLPSQVTISAVQLIPEQRLVRNRFWQQPDEYIMSKQEYISYFPHDEYKNETDISTWPEGDIVFKRSDSTVATGKFSVNAFKWTAGFYKIIATTIDEDGKEIKNVAHVELFDVRSNQLNKPEYLWSKLVETPVEPGEIASVQIGTAADKVHLISEVEKQKQENEFSFTKLEDEKKTFNYKISEADRGGFGVNYFFVKDNRFFQVSDIINVPWSNKELQIEYATFRDKTLPGSEETWKVRIRGNKNEKVAAEMLASMYDASLDQFKPHNWQTPSIWPTFRRLFSWNGTQNFDAVQSEVKWNETRQVNFEKVYDQFIFSTQGRRQIVLRGARTMAPAASDLLQRLEGKVAGVVVQNSKVADSASFSEVVVAAIGKKEELKQAAIQPRKNFNETAFFFPDLRTDENGTIEFSFTMPEALTKWKLQTMAHTKELAFGLSQKELVTQKELMVQPNAPRFLRQGDHFDFVAKIVNLSDKEITGQVQLELFNTATNESVDGWFMNTFPNQYFTVATGQSEAVKFPIQVPFQFNTALTWRITARAGNLSDAEQNILPVLTNKVLITETVALPMSGTGTKAFQFDNLLQSGQSETLQNQSLTVEYTSNPAWYAVQALPYLAIAKNESVDQIWSRYYANALATHIVSAAPRLKAIFEQWKTSDTAALLSNLQKNQELKSVLLAETPWVLQAKTETEQKRNIALLFEVSNMSAELKSTAEKLRQMQSPNGGFVWFTGGPNDRYMTQNILTGIGHLKKIGVQVKDLNDVTKAALNYLDNKIKEDYDKLRKSKADLTKPQIAPTQIQYLYMRSFFSEEKIPANSNTAYVYYKKQAKQFWTKQDILLQGMIALLLHRTGDVQPPSAILRSLKETSIYNQELGRYWKDNSFGSSWRWWHAPIETQSLMVEVFSEIANDTKTVNELRTWLIKNKQTNNWRTSKATADAVYAMLLNGTDWLTQETTVQIQLGNMVVTNRTEQGEAGTGYVKKTIEGSVVKPEMGNINVIVKTAGTGSKNAPSWGAVYWQFFEDMDKVTYAATPLQLTKKLYVEKGTDRGPVLEEVEPGSPLHTGDKIKVRILLRVDRDMEYVHMKDMRASVLEPTNVLSTYKWQGGLGYYESTQDASTEFFFNHLNKGTYVFEYPLFVSQTGSFSNGVTTIQCLYAPEFAAHSEGVKINVE
jgi:hypothetical protein